MPRQRLRPTRRQAADTPPSAQPSGGGAQRASRPASRPGPRPKPQWRETIDSFGGLLTIGAIIGAVVIVGAIFVTSRPTSTSRDVSTEALLGTTVEATDAATDRIHVTDPAEMRILEGEPPTRGPHFAVPQSVGVYQQQVPDGNAIHSLEHGIVWITYNPALVDEDMINQLEDLGDEFGSDAIVAPRPENASAIAAVSWGQILKLDSFDKAQLDDFVKTNVNRAPEPFIR